MVFQHNGLSRNQFELGIQGHLLVFHIMKSADREQTIRQKLPKGFQRAEFLLEHGAIDMIVARSKMRNTLASLLSKLTYSTKYDVKDAIKNSP
jgi:hypothetical protein